MGLLRVPHGLRVVHPYRRARPLDGERDVQGRRVADVVALRLERRTEHAGPAPRQRSVAQFAGQIDHPGAATQVDLVDVLEEGDGLIDAELAGAGHEGTDVLGQAAAAEAETGA